ncbi:Helix-turn-helix domain protein [Pelotomaculum schinkii]|uniref:Helix-turn-helix domain protein n=1 Tax=Pelotomaculum schinkii TaxID=78350 RepID=A0A4Y7R823_9FIRM|nr:helix-turn-helix transcriptional regulator [Pelotomaculum schinkii]TEB04780.1 Helix-turn-helix domain protein [Pelotomaculum schinkii]
MSISDRLLKARKTLNLTQADFAKPLGIDRGYISTLEHDSRAPSETLLKLIEHEHGISVTWLKTGEGQMLVPPEEVIIDQIARFGEQTILNAFNFVIKKHDLTVDTDDPELNRMINTLYDLWAVGDERLKAWASMQFDIAFPKHIVEEAKKQKTPFVTSVVKSDEGGLNPETKGE